MKTQSLAYRKSAKRRMSLETSNNNDAIHLVLVAELR